MVLSFQGNDILRQASPDIDTVTQSRCFLHLWLTRLNCWNWAVTAEGINGSGQPLWYYIVQ